MTLQRSEALLLKFTFAGSTAMYFFLIQLIEHFVLYDTESGFNYAPTDPIAAQLLYVFAGVAAVSAVLHFVIPQRIQRTETAFVVRLAFAELIGMLGFLLYLFAGWIEPTYVFLLASFLLILLGDRAQKAL